jgi:hypothetical protein
MPSAAFSLKTALKLKNWPPTGGLLVAAST